MKIEEVPQDRGYLIEGKISDLNYAVDENGHYTSRRSKGWQPKNEAITMAWEVIYERAEEVRRQVLDGRLSPIAFYMEINVMNVSILASYAGISGWKVKRHLKMKHFKKLRPELLAKYAAALNISTAELVDAERIRRIEIKHED
jgi:hypothetical protein